MIKKILLFLFLISHLQVSVAAWMSLEEQRREFLFADKLIKKGEDPSSFIWSDSLRRYPLYPYIQYLWLKKNLGQTEKIKAFLKDHKDTRYAGLLRYKWQLHLAKHKNWPEYIQQYQKTSNTKLQCYYYAAKYNAGAKREALTGAKKLWVVGKSQPSECDSVFKVLLKSKYFTRDMLWQRFDAAVTKGSFSVAKYVKGLMNKKNQKLAQLWLDVHTNPSLIKDQKKLNKKQAQAGLIFAHGIDRLSRKNLADAIKLWDKRKNDFTINSATVRRIEQRLAMSLAYNREDDAYDRLSKLSKPDDKAKEWRIRTALRAQNWPNVEASIANLSTKFKKKEKWRYWLARAAENTNKPRVAGYIYSELAAERSFYGYLSAEKLNKDYQLSDSPIHVKPDVYKRFKNKKDFLVVSELIKVDKKLEAERQWWYAIKKLDKNQILQAAKYAQELNWKKVAIFTIAKAKYWDDVAVRFPLAFKDQVQKNAKVQQLNPAIIFGLIRRESAFNKEAYSPVGARGLMQIMPKTGQQIARELKEKWKNKDQLFNPETNVKYGSYYYKKLLNRFNGHYALAAAAYNAGPHRVKRWLPTGNIMAADIWIETIPFKETRGYVSAVLTYALIYQKQLKENILSMKDFMRDVLPK
jgi:soluble lytic murein transglycosylase